MKDQTTLKYAPVTVLVRHRGRFRELPVIRYVAHPPNAHPKECPLVTDCTALELVTEAGSRWHGCEEAFINSELRMVIRGFDTRNELVAKWENATL